MMKVTNDGPFGLKRITLNDGQEFYINNNGIFDMKGQKTELPSGISIDEQWKTLDLYESVEIGENDV